MRNALSIIIIPIVLLLFYNQAANWHLHKLPNGIVIEHAHPYAKDKTDDTPFQKHSHNNFEYLVLALISSSAGIVVIALFLSLILFVKEGFVQSIYFNYNLIKVFFPNDSPLRAPPTIK
jgi:hypothetical protein